MTCTGSEETHVVRNKMSINMLIDYVIIVRIVLYRSMNCKSKLVP